MNFITAVPSFTDLNLNDQCVLSKGCMLEVICLCMASDCKIDTQSITLKNGETLSCKPLGKKKNAINSLLVSTFITFIKHYLKIGLSRTETALLAALLTLVELRHGLQEADAVENTRRTVFQALITYLNSNPHVSQSTFDRCRDVLRNVYVLMEMSEKLKMKLKEI